MTVRHQIWLKNTIKGDVASVPMGVANLALMTKTISLNFEAIKNPSYRIVYMHKRMHSVRGIRE
jgi:hypothetical protein